MHSTTTFRGDFVYLESKLWNTKQLEIKNAIPFQHIKYRLTTWDGPCDCSKWKYYVILNIL